MKVGDIYYYPDYSAYGGFHPSRKVWAGSDFDILLLLERRICDDVASCSSLCSEMNEAISGIHTKSYVNLYRGSSPGKADGFRIGSVFSTKEDAEKSGKEILSYIKTIDI